MKLSILLTYYNALEYLEECLQSIRENPPGCSYEVIVVDDGSDRRPDGVIAGVLPDTRLIRNAANLGFAAANNVAWRAAAGDMVLFLNSDTRILRDALDTLVAALETDPEAAAVGPMVLNADGSFQPQCRRGWLTPLTGLTYSLRLDRLFPDHPLIAQYLLRYTDRTAVQHVRSLSGCCMLFRRQVLERHGGFDETLYQYGEDLDLCYRIGNAGYAIVYDPGAAIIHYGGEGGTNFRVVRSLYYFHRSLWVIFRRYNTRRGFPLYAWFVVLMLSLRFLLAVAPLMVGVRRAGTRKGAQRFRPEAAPKTDSSHSAAEAEVADESE